jgi:hypothetical protein
MIRLFRGLLGHTRRGGMHEREGDDAPGVWAVPGAAGMPTFACREKPSRRAHRGLGR